MKVVNRKEAECIVFTHEKSPNETLHCVKRWVSVVQEGIPIHLFDKNPRIVVLEELVTQGNLNYPETTGDFLFFMLMGMLKISTGFAI